jgi:hypothetical protein
MKNFIEFKKNIYSQKGQDGVLEEVFRQLDIKNGYCVELGAWDGIYLSNTRHLITSGWGGCCIEADSDKFNVLKENNKNFKNVHSVNSFVDCNNVYIEDILKAVNCPIDFDFISIDVDGDDYHIWDSMKKFSPKVVLIETSIEFPITKEHVSALGNRTPPISCSPLSVYKLGISKGYTAICFVAHDWLFIRNDLMPKIDIVELDYSKIYYAGTEMTGWR